MDLRILQRLFCLLLLLLLLSLLLLLLRLLLLLLLGCRLLLLPQSFLLLPLPRLLPFQMSPPPPRQFSQCHLPKPQQPSPQRLTGSRC